MGALRKVGELSYFQSHKIAIISKFHTTTVHLQGPPGVDGEDGIDGQPGRPGKPGLDGLDIPLEPEPSFPW